MTPLSADTPLEIEQRWLTGLREKGPLWRLRQAVSTTSLCWRAAQEAVQRRWPLASAMERDVWLLQERYGAELATKVIERRQQRGFYGNSA